MSMYTMSMSMCTMHTMYTVSMSMPCTCLQASNASC